MILDMWPWWWWGSRSIGWEPLVQKTDSIFCLRCGTCEQAWPITRMHALSPARVLSLAQEWADQWRLALELRQHFLSIARTSVGCALLPIGPLWHQMEKTWGWYQDTEGQNQGTQETHIADDSLSPWPTSGHAWRLTHLLKYSWKKRKTMVE